MVPSAREPRPAEEPQAGAEDPTVTSPSADTPAPGEPQAPVTEHPVATRPGESQPSATEKPVVTRRHIAQYVVSVDDATGTIVKIEKVDGQTGQPKEFTPEEYAAAYSFASYAGYGAPYGAQYAAPLYAPLSNPTVQAYLKAMSDYLKAFTAQR